MKLLSSPVFWIFVGAGAAALIALSSSLAACFTLRQQDVQIETVKAWLTGGNSIAYYQPLRRGGNLGFFIRHGGEHPAYDVIVRVHEVRDGVDRLIEGPFKVGTLSGGSGMDWTSPMSLRFFPDPPPAGTRSREFRIEIQARNGLIVQRLKLCVIDGRWNTNSRTISGAAFGRGITLPEFDEAQDQRWP